MISFSTIIRKFASKGEKSGWTYIEISKSHAEKLHPAGRTSFRVKGKLDQHPVEKIALLPMGDGKFIMPLNATLRKAIGKQAGDSLQVKLQADERAFQISADFMKCLKDDARALQHFKSLPGAHQRYISKWIDSAKTVSTKTKRITTAVITLGNGQGFREMLYANRRPG